MASLVNGIFVLVLALKVIKLQVVEDSPQNGSNRYFRLSSLWWGTRYGGPFARLDNGIGVLLSRYWYIGKKCRKEALSNVHVVWDQPGVTWATACSSSVAAVSSAFSWVVRASG